MIYKSYLSTFLLTTIIILTLVNNVKAQKMFYPGYVITNEGDTVSGKIPYDLGTNNNYHIVDVKDAKGFVRKFNVWQIKMYSINNEQYYTKKCERGEMKHRNDLVFMHLLQTGEFTLYEYEFVRKIGGARSYEEGGLTPEGDKDFYVEQKDGTLIYFTRLNYKKEIKALIQNKEDCMAITNDKDFEYKKIPEVIKCYNEK